MWEPVLTPSFITRYNIVDFCRVYNPSLAAAPYVLYGSSATPAPVPAPPASAPPGRPLQLQGGKINNLS